jgi:hypothetical protein
MAGKRDASREAFGIFSDIPAMNEGRNLKTVLVSIGGSPARSPSIGFLL